MHISINVDCRYCALACEVVQMYNLKTHQQYALNRLPVSVYGDILHVFLLLLYIGSTKYVV